jgi:hypothetical protein
MFLLSVFQTKGAEDTHALSIDITIEQAYCNMMRLDYFPSS